MSDVRQCTMPRCGREAVDPTRAGALCVHHVEAIEDGPGDDETEPTPAPSASEFPNKSESGGWDTADFTAPESDTWPPAWESREFWMARKGKKPFAPWGDRDSPDGECTKPEHDAETTADCPCDARFKWSITDNWADKATVDEWVSMDPSLDGHVVLLEKEDDPYTDDPDPFAFVDGDDVRCPETGEVHPTFIELLQRLGLTYADVSTSGSGVHAMYEGQLPDEFPNPQANFDIDSEPWGENDDPPTVEIYDGNRVCVVTGEHVPGSADDIQPWDADALEEILEENVDEEDRQTTGHDTDRERPDMDGYEPTVTKSDETTGEIRDVFAAIDRLGVHDLPLRTQQVGTDGTGWEKWDPSTYRTSSGNDSLHTPDREAWYDQKTGRSFGLLGLFAGEQGIISKPWHDLSGAKFWEAVEKAREFGASIPEYEAADAPVANVPFERIAELNDADAKQLLRAEGHEWPDTSEVRERLRNRLFQAFRAGESVAIDGPTGVGKSHFIATEPWMYRTDITGDAPVIHLSPTRDARDENAEKSREAGVNFAVLKGRKDRCPVARGDHDPNPDGRNPDVVLTVNGEPASVWIDRQCDEKGNPFQLAHAYAAEYNDQGEQLPCCAGDADCPAMSQWDGVPRDEDGNPSADVIHATHPFAYVPSLRLGTNVVIDEGPSAFTVELSQDRIRRAVNAYLDAVNAPVKTYEGLVTLATTEGYAGDIGPERDALEGTLGDAPEREWYVEHPDAHALAPDLTRAIYQALRWEDPDANGRRSTRVLHEPPRFDDDQEDGFGGNFLSVVVDREHTVRSIRHTPDFSVTRSVVGLDAHPCAPIWRRNVGPRLSVDRVLDHDERRLWRRFERGLTVVQVGDTTRPLSGTSAAEWFGNDWKLDVLLRSLRERYGDEFRTAITAAAAETAMRNRMVDAGVSEPETMHYGEETSRNDFAGESIGLINGCIDPGDGYVLDLLAELELEATPERADPTDRDDPTTALCVACGGRRCSECNDTGLKRARGRGFTGPDADTAELLLASVRDNHVAQAAGRYGRNADDPTDTATVYVRTDAIPDGFADVKVNGVEWVASELQREIVHGLVTRDDGATAKGLAEDADCTPRHVQRTLRRLEEQGVIEREPGAGPNPDLWFAPMGTFDRIEHVELLGERPDPPPELNAADNSEKARTRTYRVLVRGCSRFSAENGRLSVPTKMSIVSGATVIPDEGERDPKPPDGPPPDRIVPGG